MKEFKHYIENSALYSPLLITQESQISFDDLPRVNPNFYCDGCDSIQTFTSNEYKNLQRNYTAVAGKELVLIFHCLGCKGLSSKKWVALSFSEVEKKSSDSGSIIFQKVAIKKIGMYPAWSIDPSSDLKKILGGEIALYKKGLTNESQGYGIGAFSYYRRVIENIIDQLLDTVLDVVPDSEKDNLQKQIIAAKKEKNAEDRIKHASKALPPSLFMAGHNPLSLLYGHLSDGLHNLSDEDCLERAHKIRKILEHLSFQIQFQKNSFQEYKESINTLDSMKK